MCEVFSGTNVCPRARDDLEEELQRLRENTGAFAKSKAHPHLQALCWFSPVKEDKSSSTIGELSDSAVANSLNPHGPAPRGPPQPHLFVYVFSEGIFLLLWRR